MTKNDDKALVTLALKTAIKKQDFERLPDMLPLAKKHNVQKKLLIQGWLLLAEGSLERKDYVNAVLSFNSARSFDLRDKRILARLLDSIDHFYGQFREVFSWDDLVLLADALERLLGFYRINGGPGIDDFVSSASGVLAKVKRHREIADEKIETAASFKVGQIWDALYSDMTMEEVRSEFARILAPYLRDEIDAKKKKAKRNKKKPPTASTNPTPKPV
jgi:hypothetical protein